MVAPLGFAALILGLAYGVGPIDRLLASRPVFWLGEISFSLYMIHSLPIDLASWLVVQGTLPASPALLLAAVAVSIVLAALTFHLVETPFRRLGRAMLRRPAAVATA